MSVPALRLEELTWPEVADELRDGRCRIVVPFGALEQHGPHLPLVTDTMLGDALGEAVAERLTAFVSPTMPFGCSRHHSAFPGTISLEDETLGLIVRDVVHSLTSIGFKQLLLLPAHGGNFGPIARGRVAGSPTRHSRRHTARHHHLAHRNRCGG